MAASKPDFLSYDRSERTTSRVWARVPNRGKNVSTNAADRSRRAYSHKLPKAGNRSDDVVDEIRAGLLAREVDGLFGDTLDVAHAESDRLQFAQHLHGAPAHEAAKAAERCGGIRLALVNVFC